MKDLTEERIDYFLSEFKSYKYFKHEIKYIESKLKDIERELREPSISSPQINDVIIENKTYHNRTLELMKEEEELISKKTTLTQRLALLEEILSKLPRDVSDIICKVYINGANQEAVAMQYNYSRFGLINHVKSSIRKELRKGNQ